MKKIILISVTVAILISFGVYIARKQSFGSAPAGMKTIVASSTVKAIVGPQAPTAIFSATVDCTSRVITTYANPIMLTFATSTDLDQTVKPTAIFGHYQAASTTVAYDSGLYGCDLWQAYGYTATDTISISEFKGFR